MDHFQFLFSPTANALAESLVYSFAQSFVIFLCVYGALKFMPAIASKVKYLICYAAYMLMAAGFIATFIYKLIILPSPAAPFVASVAEFSVVPPADSSVSVFSLAWLTKYLPFVTAAYLAGITWFAARFCYEFFQTNSLRKKYTSPIEAALLQRFSELLLRMDITRKVSLRYSARVCNPLMIGYIKPVILLPFSIIARLSPAQVEAILLHELAHIRRHDYLLNFIQSVADTLLFFNPFAVWLTDIVREEREKCCDEMVLRSSDRFDYANALLALRSRDKNQQLVLASVGKKLQLLNRIKNIVEMKQNKIYPGQKLIAFVVVLVATFSTAWLRPAEKPVYAFHAQNYYSHAFRQVFNQTIFQPLLVGDRLRVVDSTPVLPAAPPPPPAIAGIQAPPPSPLPVLPGMPPVAPVAPVPPVLPAAPLPPLPPLDSIPQADSFFNSQAWKQQEAAIKKSSEAMRKYFQSKEWKDQQLLIKKNSLAMKKYFNSPEWKKQQQLIRKNNEKMQRYFSSPEWKKQQLAIEQNTAKIQQYFNSDDWKKQQEEIQKNAEKMQQYFNSAEWKKQQEEIQKSGQQIQKYFNSADWKKQQQEIQKNAEKMQRYFNSAEWKKQQDEIKKNTEKMQQYFNSPEWKKAQLEIQHAADSSFAFFKTGAWRQQQDALKKSMEELKTYLESSEWKKSSETLKRQ